MAYIAGVAKRFRVLYYKGDEMNKRQQGFTLVELAIVLVIIGLILGMAFKGRSLIDGARVKNMATQAANVQTAFNAYFERYNAFPGDGCNAAPAAGATTCPAAIARNGLLPGPFEAAAALTLLQNTNILSASDLRSATGNNWTIRNAGAATAAYAGNTNYLFLAAADIRMVCALDRLIDDGVPNTGNVRSNAGIGAGNGQYNSDTAAANPVPDCWALNVANQQVGVRLLP